MASKSRLCKIKFKKTSFRNNGNVPNAEAKPYGKRYYLGQIGGGVAQGIAGGAIGALLGALFGGKK